MYCAWWCGFNIESAQAPYSHGWKGAKKLSLFYPSLPPPTPSHIFPGLRAEDLIRDEADGVQEALKRMPQDFQDERYDSSAIANCNSFFSLLSSPPLQLTYAYSLHTSTSLYVANIIFSPSLYDAPKKQCTFIFPNHASQILPVEASNELVAQVRLLACRPVDKARRRRPGTQRCDQAGAKGGC